MPDEQRSDNGDTDTRLDDHTPPKRGVRKWLVALVGFGLLGLGLVFSLFFLTFDHHVGYPTTVGSPFDPLGDKIRQLRWGNVVFNVPNQIAYGTAVRAELVMSPSLSVAELQQQLLAQQHPGAPIAERVQLSSRMRASLQPTAGLVVRALTSAEQGVSDAHVARWAWEVAPKDDFDGEPQTLDISLYALVNVEGHDADVSLRTFQRQIAVTITPYQRVGRFVGANWQWLWAAIVVPAAPAVWSRMKRKHGTAEPKARLKLRRRSS